MKQSVNGSELTYEPQKQTLSHCRTSLEVSAQHHIGKWGRMHKAYLEEVHPDLYRQLLQDGTLDRHLAEVDERGVSMLEQLTVQMARQEGVTERIHFVCSGLLALDPKSDKTDLLAIEYTCVDQ